MADIIPPLLHNNPHLGKIVAKIFFCFFFTSDPGPCSIRCCIDILQLEGHSVERIYLQQRSADGSVNKTILEPRLAVAARRQDVYTWNFPNVKFRIAKFRSLCDIGENNPVPASGL